MRAARCALISGLVAEVGEDFGRDLFELIPGSRPMRAEEVI